MYPRLVGFITIYKHGNVIMDKLHRAMINSTLMTCYA